MSEVVNFEIEVPLAGAMPRSLLFQDPPGGMYQVQINGVKQVTNEKEGGKTTLRFQTLITDEGEARGMFMQVVMGTDWTKDFNQSHLLNLLTGIGFPLEAVQKNVKITPQFFLGKKAYVKVTPAPEGEVDENGRRKFADKTFCMRSDYETYKRATSAIPNAETGAAPANAAAPAPIRTPAAAPAPAPVPTPPSGGAVDLASMFPG